MYQELADMACNRITAAITRKFLGERPIKALLNPYNPTGSTRFVRFNTSKPDRWETNGPPIKNQVNWVILDSDWEGEFCRAAESHPKVIAYTKNHNLGLEVPYRYGSETRKYLPDFIVLIDDGHPPKADGTPNLLHLIVEIKGYRREDAKEKKSTMETYWVPGVNQLGTQGRWAFAEFTDVYQIESDLKTKIEEQFAQTIETALGREFTPMTVLRNRAEAKLRDQLVQDRSAFRLNETIWNVIEQSDRRSVQLGDLIPRAQSEHRPDWDTDKVLAVLSLLSQSTDPSLEMRLLQNGRQVDFANIRERLADWWRAHGERILPLPEWTADVEVDWVPARSERSR
jgi:type III restriction enzyme